MTRSAGHLLPRRCDAHPDGTGQAPHVLASLNNLALGLLGRLGITKVAEAQRAFVYHLDKALFGQR